MDLGLRGKKAIITGGTRGIGRAIAEALASEGCDIGLCARGEAAIAPTLEALRAKGVAATGAAGDFDFITRQQGMFSFSGLSAEQVARLREEHSVLNGWDEKDLRERERRGVSREDDAAFGAVQSVGQRVEVRLGVVRGRGGHLPVGR